MPNEEKICPMMSSGEYRFCEESKCQWWVVGYAYERDGKGIRNHYPQGMCCIAFLAVKLPNGELPL